VPTIGQCKGTLQRYPPPTWWCVSRAIVHPLAQDVMDGGTRVLMIIDAPDDLEQLMRRAAQRLQYAESLYKEPNPSGSAATPEPTDYMRRIPVMTQWGYADERAHFDHWGGGHIHTFPNEGSATAR